MVNLYVYSDESGVFDISNYDYYAYGGVMFADPVVMQDCLRKYLNIEEQIRKDRDISNEAELKAAMLTPLDRRRLFQTTSAGMRFGIIIHEKKILPQIFDNKKTKQRFLDYAYLCAIGRCINQQILAGTIKPEEVINLYFNVDEHTSATNGKYELHESLEQYFQIGTFSSNWDAYYPPIFPNVSTIKLKYCNSASTPLIRAADIIANKVLQSALTETSVPFAIVFPD